jgi:Tol biopolymer transport system component
MLCSSRRHPMLQSSRSTLPRLLVLAASLALGACDGTNNPLAPTGEPTAPADVSPATATEAAAPDFALTAATSPRIVFTSTRKGGYDIFKMDFLGSSVARLTSSIDWEFSPAWSRNNSRIALVRPRRDANNVAHYDIYVINADGSNGHWARSAPSSYDLDYPDWSPDGSRLVVNVNIWGTWYVGWIALATGQLGVYTTGYGGLPGRYPTYSPTGQIVYTGGSGLTIDRINADGSGHKTLASSTYGDGEPAVSPDGKKIAFDKANSGFNQDIYVKDLVSGTTTRLTTSSGPDLQPCWSADGSKIAFMSSRSGQSQIWTMNASTGGSQTRITHTSTVEKDPACSH